MNTGYTYSTSRHHVAFGGTKTKRNTKNAAMNRQASKRPPVSLYETSSFFPYIEVFILYNKNFSSWGKHQMMLWPRVKIGNFIFTMVPNIGEKMKLKDLRIYTSMWISQFVKVFTQFSHNHRFLLKKKKTVFPHFQPLIFSITQHSDLFFLHTPCQDPESQ